jgi:hypothetical protein
MQIEGIIIGIINRIQYNIKLFEIAKKIKNLKTKFINKW